MCITRRISRWRTARDKKKHNSHEKERNDVATCLPKAKIMKPAETDVARKLVCKHAHCSGSVVVT
jgi:hypothetical protein